MMLITNCQQWCAQAEAEEEEEEGKGELCQIADIAAAKK